MRSSYAQGGLWGVPPTFQLFPHSRSFEVPVGNGKAILNPAERALFSEEGSIISAHHRIHYAAIMGAVVIVIAGCQPDSSSPPAAEETRGAASDSVAGPAPNTSFATVHRLTGVVEASSGPLAMGKAVEVGEEIQTREGSALALDLEDGTRIIVNERTHLKLDRAATTGDPAHVTLVEGELYAVSSVNSSPLNVEFGLPEDESKVSGEVGLSLIYDPATGEGGVTCLDGQCRITGEGQETVFEGGQGFVFRKVPGRLKWTTISLREWIPDEERLWLAAMAFGETDPAPFLVLRTIVYSDPAPFPILLPHHVPPGPEHDATVAVVTGEQAEDAINHTPLVVGKAIHSGGKLSTAEAASTALHLPDGTVIILNESTILHVVEISGTPDAPIVRLDLEQGEVFLIHEGPLPEGGMHEVTLGTKAKNWLPANFLSIEAGNSAEGAGNDSMAMSVAYYPETADVFAAVIAGSAELRDAEGSTNLPEGATAMVRGWDPAQKREIVSRWLTGSDGGVSDIGDATISTWLGALHFAFPDTVESDLAPFPILELHGSVEAAAFPGLTEHDQRVEEFTHEEESVTHVTTSTDTSDHTGDSSGGTGGETTGDTSDTGGEHTGDTTGGDSGGEHTGGDSGGTHTDGGGGHTGGSDGGTTTTTGGDHTGGSDGGTTDGGTTTDGTHTGGTTGG